MPEATESEDAIVERNILVESNRAMTRAAGYAAYFGFGSAVLILLLEILGLARQLEVAGVFAVFAGACSLGLHRFARRQELSGMRAYALFLPFVSLPSVFFLASGFLLPGGVATFITGPFSYLYFVLIIISGFMFDARLARLSGVLCGVEYLGCWLLARHGLAQLSALDAATLQDLTAAPIYVVKATMMAMAGWVVGRFASLGRGLTMRVLHEEREIQGISRLFGQFVSPEVKDKILRDGAALTGERKRVVVLFSDIRSFTTYSETLEPEALIAHLNEYFDRMVAAITAHGGVIDKFIGDAVMAVFGGLLDLPNPAHSALKAAVQMRRELRELNRRWVAEGKRPLDNGIGLHLGEVVQGPLGSRERKEFTVIGDTVNTASRLESATKELGYSILLSAETVAALPVAERAVCLALGRTHLKGKQRDVEVFGVIKEDS